MQFEEFSCWPSLILQTTLTLHRAHDLTIIRCIPLHYYLCITWGSAVSYVFNYFVITKGYTFSNAIRLSVSNVSMSLRFSCPAVFEYCGDSRVWQIISWKMFISYDFSHIYQLHGDIASLLKALYLKILFISHHISFIIYVSSEYQRSVLYTVLSFESFAFRISSVSSGVLDIDMQFNNLWLYVECHFACIGILLHICDYLVVMMCWYVVLTDFFRIGAFSEH